MSEENGWDDFLRAAMSDHDLELVREALAQGADPNLDVDGDGARALCWAAESGRIEEAEALLEAGATVAREWNPDGRLGPSTSLHAAAEHGDLPMVELLLRADGTVALNWFDYVSRTPLMCAVENDSREVARRLIAAGADVNANEEARIGDTALHIAAQKGLYEMAELLLQAGADPTIRGWMWLTPLDIAQQRKEPEGLRLAALLAERARG